MEFSPEERLVFEGLERRKQNKDESCDSCDGSGAVEGFGCPDCLGQAILLTQDEYELLRRITQGGDDSILSAEYLN